MTEHDRLQSLIMGIVFCRFLSSNTRMALVSSNKKKMFNNY